MNALIGVLLLPLWCITTMFFWGFAFLHLPEATPDWLLRAQAACFGTNETGLPDTYGWMLLTLAPGSILVGMIVAMREEMITGLKSLRSILIGRVLLTALATTLIIEAVWITGRVQQGIEIAYASYDVEDIGAFPDDYPRSDEPAPDFTLIDQSGQKISLKSLLGENVILTFILAHCKTICPAMLKIATKAHSALPPDSTELLFVTLDPWRDSPGSLPSLAERWELLPSQRVLSGEVAEVERIISAYNVTAQRDQRTGDVTHPALYFLINREGKIIYKLNSPSAEWIIAAVNRLNKES